MSSLDVAHQRFKMTLSAAVHFDGAAMLLFGFQFCVFTFTLSCKIFTQITVEVVKTWRKDMGREHTAFKSDREVRNKTGSEGVVCYRPKTNPRSKQRLMAEIRLELENHWPFHIQCTGNVDFITISMKINLGTMSNLFNLTATWYNYWKWIYRDPRRKPWSHPTQLEKGTVMTW